MRVCCGARIRFPVTTRGPETIVGTGEVCVMERFPTNVPDMQLPCRPPHDEEDTVALDKGRAEGEKVLRKFDGEGFLGAEEAAVRLEFEIEDEEGVGRGEGVGEGEGEELELLIPG